ncbi:MAG: gliding motility lipoprotein GldH [Bacteroidetes bacterium]|nr:gliding motility lipoprotein GldH [Bacteroidota bacterium]
MFLLTNRFLWSLAAVVLLLSSCDQRRVMEENQDVQDYQWNYSDTKVFTAEIQDTTTQYNIYVNLRHAFQFEWRNLWVNIETTFPNGKVYERRVNLLLSEPDGHWYGDCLGDNCDIQVSIQQNAFFPLTGKYTFKITQDMRVNPLPYIKSVGMRVERVQPEK